MTTVKHVSNLTPADILSVYSGKNGKCCCGCAGKHSYNSKHVDAGTARRGYAVDADDVNDAMITRVLNIIKQQVEATEDADVKIADGCVALVVGARLYVLYLLDTATKLTAKKPLTREGVREDIAARVANLIEVGHVDAVGALRIVCGAELVDSMIEKLYHELRAKAVR